MKKRIRSALLVVTLLIVSIKYSYGVQATSVEALKDQQEELSKEEQQLEQEKKKLQDKLDSLNSDMLDLSESVYALEESIAKGEEQIAKTQKKLKKAEAVARKQYNEMKLRIQYMYENRVTNWLDVYLSSSGMADFLNQIDYISELSNYDRMKLTEYQDTKEQIKENKAELVSRQKELLKEREDLAVKQKELLSHISEVKSDISDKDQSLENQKKKKEQLATQIRAMEEYERKLEEQRAKEEAERQAKEKEQQKETQKESSNSGKKVSASGSEKDLLAALIYCEAGGESYTAQVAVGSVVMNRIHSSSFPNSLTGVIYQSGQFSPAASGKLALVLENGFATDSCKRAAARVLNGGITGNWLFFCFNTGAVNGTVIGKQVFY